MRISKDGKHITLTPKDSTKRDPLLISLYDKRYKELVTLKIVFTKKGLGFIIFEDNQEELEVYADKEYVGGGEVVSIWKPFKGIE